MKFKELTVDEKLNRLSELLKHYSIVMDDHTDDIELANLHFKVIDSIRKVATHYSTFNEASIKTKMNWIKVENQLP